MRSLGLSFVEASADTEADPLYAGPEYMEDWVFDVNRCARREGVRVSGLYSGHGTYTTLGLAHTDARVRRRMAEQWLQPMIRAAAGLHAGLGFYCHAFPEAVLQDPASYAGSLALLEDELSQAAAYAAAQGLPFAAVEQMYSPHQVPWTIEGARALMAGVYAKRGFPLLVTIDTGHQTGQRRFLRPELSVIARKIEEQGPRSHDSPWLGTVRASERFEESARDGGSLSPQDLAFISAEMDRHPYLFCATQDGDPYAWLEALGRFSPIIHLQQVTEGQSAHLPFTAEMNARGMIRAERVLRALAQSYTQHKPDADGLPAPAREIYLTLEIFSGTSEPRTQILGKLRESVEYWRRFVPRDGLRLDELVSRLE